VGSYQTALQPVINGAQPETPSCTEDGCRENVCLTLHPLNQLQRDSEQYDDDLSIGILAQLYEPLFVLPGGSQPCQYVTFRETIKISTTGYPQQRVFDLLYSEIPMQSGNGLNCTRRNRPHR